MNRPLLACVTMFLLFATESCNPLSETTVIATVADRAITVRDLQRHHRIKEVTAELPPDRTPQETEALKRKLLEELIEHHLLLQQAEASGIQVEEQAWNQYLERLQQGYSREFFEAQLKSKGISRQIWEKGQREKWLIQQWITIEVKKADGVTPQALRNYYEKNRTAFVEPEKVRARHIVVATRNEAEELLARLKKGDDFAELARQFSTGPEAPGGGDLGYFTLEDYPPPFTETCFSLRKGENSAIVPSDYGFHLFQVLDQKPARQQTFEEVTALIERRLMSDRLEQWMEETLRKLRIERPVKINQDVLRKVPL